MRVWLATVVVASLAGCGWLPSESTSVVEADPVDNPYDGPMSVEPDYRDRATVMERSGAAGLALECVFEPYQGGSGDYDSGLASVQDSAEEALDNWMEEEAWLQWIPTTGYRVERDDGDRVLLSYDVDEQTKIAFVAADGIHDWDDHDGWGIESWAECDPAELPPDVSDELGYGVWEDAAGQRVPTSVIRSFQGAEHCDWQDITFLEVGPENESDEYVRDAEGVFGALLRSTFDPNAALPANATDSGYVRDGRELWLTRDGDAAYLVSVENPDDVERWPASKQGIGCD